MMSKEIIHQQIDEMASELFALSDFIHANPELGHQEFQAQARLVKEFQGRGFEVETGIGGFPTSFKATLPQRNSGPTVAFVAEYDALPGLGHGCGHNLISAAALGAATVLKGMIDAGELSGNVLAVGTPGEEVPPGTKGVMVEKGVFDDVDVAMITHAKDRTHTGGQLRAMNAIKFHFKGRPSHAAASPEKGISALDAALLTVHAIELLREHVRDDVRIHGIITEGGEAPNIVPERASLYYYIRALDRPCLEQVVARVENCARAGALATGAEVTIENLGSSDSRLNVETLNNLLLENARQAGARRILPPPSGFGSADFGNVTHRLPAATLYVELIPEGTSLHTAEAAEAAGGEAGHHVVRVGAKAMACTAYELLSQEDLLARIKDEFVEVEAGSVV
jgi:amidohydrolase